ncbi:hypothetical protein psyc5s11_10720 [Clostridium gelidum]|uniref:Uncharacterized protein n=1 Tax=Clostridium gelidum TaxID=704125 RepID=A0ABM7T2C5_9CLOT|nr:hypothetical protein psyc5s11_10720 [Clostridium gelidum]
MDQRCDAYWTIIFLIVPKANYIIKVASNIEKYKNKVESSKSWQEFYLNYYPLFYIAFLKFPYPYCIFNYN